MRSDRFCCDGECRQGRGHDCPMPETPSLRNPWVLLVYATAAVAAAGASALIDHHAISALIDWLGSI